jgi:hypothetical protein
MSWYFRLKFVKKKFGFRGERKTLMSKFNELAINEILNMNLNFTVRIKISFALA